MIPLPEYGAHNTAYMNNYRYLELLVCFSAVRIQELMAVVDKFSKKKKNLTYAHATGLWLLA